MRLAGAKLRAFLKHRMSTRKFIECHAISHDALDGWNPVDLDIEGLRNRPDADKTDVRDGRLIAMKNLACFRLCRETRLESLQIERQPVTLPGAPRGFIEAARRR